MKEGRFDGMEPGTLETGPERLPDGVAPRAIRGAPEDRPVLGFCVCRVKAGARPEGTGRAGRLAFLTGIELARGLTFVPRRGAFCGLVFVLGLGPVRGFTFGVGRGPFWGLTLGAGRGPFWGLTLGAGRGPF